MKPTYKKLVKALELAIGVYQYASMTSWEREYTAEDRKFVEGILERTKNDQKGKT